MAILKTNDSTTFDGNTNSQRAETATSRTDTWHGPWEFFKDVIGLRTRPINQQIGLASTAVTPDLSLPTKAIFVNIIKAKDTLLVIKNKIKQISDTIDEDHSDRLKQKQIVKINIVNAYNKYYKSGDK